MGTDLPLTGQIKHVVVLMFENRSFDNMLGWLYPDKTQAEYAGLNGIPTPQNSYYDPSTGAVTTASNSLSRHPSIARSRTWRTYGALRTSSFPASTGVRSLTGAMEVWPGRPAASLK